MVRVSRGEKGAILVTKTGVWTGCATGAASGSVHRRLRGLPPWPGSWPGSARRATGVVGLARGLKASTAPAPGAGPRPNPGRRWTRRSRWRRVRAERGLDWQRVMVFPWFLQPDWGRPTSFGDAA